MRAIEFTVAEPIEQAEAMVRQALSDQGFGVLTEIDVAATFKAKLGLDRDALKILGACNPALAHRALEIDPSAALMLPCNVVLSAAAKGTNVAIADPRELMPDPSMADLATEAAARLTAVASALSHEQ
ncbi:MAG: DUF302 domain-containing protein [Actinomycetota bacterium]|jgi:uncharacterized protein (DUF302 family)|nr:DUF302 domain-containing protein [Actinomycetota bacterium]